MKLNKTKFKDENIKLGFNLFVGYLKQASIKELCKIRGQLNSIIKKKKEIKKAINQNYQELI